MGRDFGITIGINKYRNLQGLRYAVSDAEALNRYLQEKLRFYQTYHFTDISEPIPQDYGPDIESLPTFSTLRRFLRTRFEKPFMQPGDSLWFSFAGHGIRYRDQDYLMTIDSDPGDISATAISLNYITERLQRCGAGNVILFLDACRGESGRRDSLGFGEDKQKGVIIFFSCSPYESSYEIDELAHGTFTYSLIQALNLKCEENCATVERLDKYLRREVPTLNKIYNKPAQNPYVRIEPLTKICLILLPQQATNQDVLAIKNNAMMAELNQDYVLAKDYWMRVLHAMPESPEAIRGIERIANSLLRSSKSGLPASQAITPIQVHLPDVHGEISNQEPLEKLSNVLEPKSGSLLDSTLDDATKGNEEINGGLTNKKVRHRIIELNDTVSLELVLIQGGRFLMGSPSSELGRQDDEGPQIEKTISPFLISKYPVTQIQWRFVASLPKVNCDINLNPSYFKGDDRPVEMVSWYEVVEFCRRLSIFTNQEYRLPSEAEWEYACRAGTKSPFHFGETITSDLANYNGNYIYGSGKKGIYRKETINVGILQSANAFGLYDVHGNVFEWCQDVWQEHYKEEALISEEQSTTGIDSQHKILRGGCWSSHPAQCRSAKRGKEKSAFKSSRIGFRIACSSRKPISNHNPIVATVT